MSNHLKGRGASIQVKNRFDSKHFVPDDGEAIEHQDGVQTQVIEIYPKSIVNHVPSPDIPMNWSMNPYQGCEHGCAYCYARPTHEYWGYNGGVDFERVVLIKKNADELLREKLSTRTWTGESIMLSGNTDCYQPIERKLEITRTLLKTCLEFGNPVGIITKNSLILRDLDILAELASKNLVHTILSITTLDETLRGLLEPRTASARQKLKAVSELSAANVPVSVMMAPIIPALNSYEIDDMAKAVSEAGALTMHFTMVRLNGCVEDVFTDWLERHYPDRKNKVLTQIADIHGGDVQDSRFSTRMRGEGNFANIIAQQFKMAKKRYGLNRKPEPLTSRHFVRKGQFHLDL